MIIKADRLKWGQVFHTPLHPEEDYIVDQVDEFDGLVCVTDPDGNMVVVHKNTNVIVTEELCPN